MRPRNSNFSRIYFIGAGFTACQGYPLGAQLISNLLDWLQKQSKRRRNKSYRVKAHEIRQQIKLVLRDYLRQNENNVDVSEFYTLVQMMSETPDIFGSSGREAELKTLYDSVSAATAELLLATWYKKALDPLPAAILDDLDPVHHAIVNFNWDEEVDAHLTKFGSGDGDDISYTLESWKNDEAELPYLLLKPHGSAGWFDIAEGITNEDSYFICENDSRIGRRERRIVSYGEVETPRRIDKATGIECPRVITPPTFAKRFVYTEQQLVWRDVIQVCSNAFEFVFLGYTLRPDDYLTRAAIRNALRIVRPAKIRCLAVGLVPDATSMAAMLSSFRSVFGNELNEKRNFLVGDFGKPKTFPGIHFDGMRGARSVLNLMGTMLRTAKVRDS